jgi:hypothetical protein
MRRWFGLVAVALLLVACGSDSDSEEGNPLVTGEAYLTFDIDGTAVTFGPEDFDTRYFTGQDKTILVGPEGGNAFYLDFQGSSAGTFTEQDMFVTYDVDPTQGFPWGFVASSAYSGSNFNLEVTAYGDVDGWITGTFSGTLVEMHDSEATGNVATVTNGAFALLRGSDK